MRVLGVDPGFGRTGLGVIDLSGNDAVHVWHDVIETSSDMSFAERLQSVRNDVQEAIRRWAPEAAAVESLFFQTNVSTAMNVGAARGVLLLCLADAELPIVEVTPNALKQGITGYGRADKKQVTEMVKRLLKLEKAPRLDDAADALALAIVGGFLHRSRRA